MKSLKLFLTVFILLVNFQVLFSQETNKNLVLFDSATNANNANCEELLARFNRLISEIYENPTFKGYIIIHGGLNTIESNFHKLFFIKYFKFRRLDEKRFSVITAKSSEKIRFEFWVSKDGTKPKVIEENLNYLLPENSKSILFVEDSLEILKSDGKSTFIGGCEACCISTIDLELLSKFLEANPKRSAHFVVYNRDAKTANQSIKIVLDKAIKDHKIPPSRLKSTYGGKGEAAEWAKNISLVKVWLVPEEKK